ncbi:MAG TPA: hypothetical protein VFO21_00635 [Vicinamibacterales bacterium]|nr:hypothetical protein [Vicinamibacterales bacterium]
MPDNDNMEPMLRNALDSVNAARRWRLIGITVLFFASAVTLAMLFTMSRFVMPPTDPGIGTATLPDVAPAAGVNRLPLKALYVASAVQMLMIAGGTAAVILQVSRMTRVILRAIESTRSK